jgi:hypothetical protein
MIMPGLCMSWCDLRVMRLWSGCWPLLCDAALQVGYVEQSDIHTPSITVTEAVWFSGRLRLGPAVSDDEVSGP